MAVSRTASVVGAVTAETCTDLDGFIANAMNVASEEALDELVDHALSAMDEGIAECGEEDAEQTEALGDGQCYATCGEGPLEFGEDYEASLRQYLAQAVAKHFD
uniref:Uncharacterized protein n=1 Tax=Alexandrium catenella TaxID=2925 RepID=A0A7S1L981_ALECA|mmetsp:Transcript_108986/g.289780  ORF Transcript_108986/g.289780 Transcript_108986/m.289780 type:complete len:104 (+) Transcript_108986:121-432(+)|eukprot:CAMPEP_0171228724 /NCGR_PEP_ID=MMETSP0790-20130122/38515_1 /TAXON_ID=2925 /ORGANISM="Alexandrium catenella, Strain OF101" /LENGTH=103 /DNA_ID=CAMNT_0011694887 /DNA_START=121 /DNA_END=432 /DNA_ORIENTATION=+